jgi:alpha-1,3-rhamnosyl/mannosyltransferase
MACGCPVVVSDIPALRELVGKAGVYIRSDQSVSSADVIRRTLASESRRRLMRIRGLRRAALFSWDTTARKTYDLYQRIFREGS